MIELPFRFPWRVFLRLTAAGAVATVLDNSLFPRGVDVLPYEMHWVTIFFVPAFLLVAWLWLLLGRSRGVLRITPFLLLANGFTVAVPLFGDSTMPPPGWYLLSPAWHMLAGGDNILAILLGATVYLTLLVAPLYLVPPLLLLRPRPGWTWLLGGWLWALCPTVVIAFYMARGVCFGGDYMLATALPVYLAGLPWLIAEARGDDWRQVGRPPSTAEPKDEP